ncbi:MAG TPA: hypothetical protein VK338_03690 [Candidatus Nitrosocosmicus sp.]|nr:hypothetical protein [Candidatus Nitrosocosmicus sp.]
MSERGKDTTPLPEYSGQITEPFFQRKVVGPLLSREAILEERLEALWSNINSLSKGYTEALVDFAKVSEADRPRSGLPLLRHKRRRIDWSGESTAYANGRRYGLEFLRHSAQEKEDVTLERMRLGFGSQMSVVFDFTDSKSIKSVTFTADSIQEGLIDGFVGEELGMGNPLQTLLREGLIKGEGTKNGEPDYGLYINHSQVKVDLSRRIPALELAAKYNFTDGYGRNRRIKYKQRYVFNPEEQRFHETNYSFIPSNRPHPEFYMSSETFLGVYDSFLRMLPVDLSSPEGTDQ